jgi:hypothetical protein
MLRNMTLRETAVKLMKMWRFSVPLPGSARRALITKVHPVLRGASYVVVRREAHSASEMMKTMTIALHQLEESLLGGFSSTTADSLVPNRASQ